jgi:hypothetical protein
MDDSRKCSHCGYTKPRDQFLSKRNQSLTNQCLQCRESKVRSVQRKRPAEDLLQFHYRGFHSSDNTQRAEARREAVTISREHRAKRRQGLEVSQTPSITQLINRHGSNTPAPPTPLINTPIRQSSLLQVDHSAPQSSQSSASTPRRLVTCYFRCLECGLIREDNTRVGDDEE